MPSWNAPLCHTYQIYCMTRLDGLFLGYQPLLLSFRWRGIRIHIRYIVFWRWWSRHLGCHSMCQDGSCVPRAAFHLAVRRARFQMRHGTIRRQFTIGDLQHVNPVTKLYIALAKEKFRVVQLGQRSLGILPRSSPPCRRQPSASIILHGLQWAVAGRT